MQTFFSNLLSDVENLLKFVNAQYESKVSQAEGACAVMWLACVQVAIFEVHYKFCSPEEEITYFKELKPKIVSKLRYYLTVHRIEGEKPEGNRQVKRDYFLRELEKIQVFFEENSSFICYYEAGENYCDHLYFRRNAGSQDRLQHPSGELEELDHHCKVVKILAYNLLQPYLHDQLRCL